MSRRDAYTSGRLTHLREDYACGYAQLPTGELRVDRDQGIIRGVKVVGLTSPNGHGRPGATRGTAYTVEALQAAAPLYHEVDVYVNHRPPEQRGGHRRAERKAEDKLGMLINPRVVEGQGLFADLVLLKSHPMSERLMEAADRMPNAYGLSHDAYGDGDIVDGRFVIDRIPQVNSVDLVARGATVQGLFESEGSTIASKTFRQVLEAANPAVAKPFLCLLEMDGDFGGMDMGMSGDAEDDTDHKPDLVTAIGKLVQSKDPKDHALAQKILKMLHPEADGGDAEAPDDEAGDEDEDDVDDKPKKTEEGRRAASKPDPAVTLLREELTVRDLIEDAGLKFAKPEARKAFIRSLVPLQEGDRKALIEERRITGSAVQRNAPRSSGPGEAPTTSKRKPVTDGQSFAAAVLQ